MSECTCPWADGGVFSRTCPVIPHAKRAVVADKGQARTYLDYNELIDQRDELLALLREALEVTWGNADDSVVKFRNKASAAIKAAA